MPAMEKKEFLRFMARGKRVSPPAKLTRPKRTAHSKNASFSLPSEFFAQRNNRVKIGASNAQSQNKLSSIMRTMSRILTGLFLTCSAVSRIRKHKTSVVIMLNP